MTQSFGSWVAPLMVERSNFLPFATATASCLLAYGFAASYRHASSDLGQEIHSADGPDASVRVPLILRREPELSTGLGGQDAGFSLLGPLGRWLQDYAGIVFSAENKNLSLVVALFFLMAVSKATRPLFTSYIRYRDGATLEQVMMAIPSYPCFQSDLDKSAELTIP
jgi:hypothetical protein